MNKIFKTISKRIRRFSGYTQNTIVVSENASSMGKTTDNRSKSSQANTSSSNTLSLLKLSTKHLITSLLVSTLTLSSINANIVADTNAPTNTQPIILNTASGATQVNIQTPTSGGISLNNYSEFNTGTNGTILNNSRTNANTVTAGWVEGNPFLSTGTARAIINQVNSSAPSSLTGNIEIAGSKADLIIANPNGISIDGATLINANATTLTTGKPIINGGVISGYDIKDGAITIEGAGLNAAGSDYTTLLSRSATVNAGIWAKDLTVKTNSTSSIALASPISIDVKNLGGMYANRISLVSNETGVGVNNSGEILSNEHISIDINGNLTNSGTIASKGNMESKSSDLINSNQISSAKELKIQTSNINNTNGEMIANRVDIVADTLNNTNGKITQTGAQLLSITTANLTNSNGGLVGVEPISGGTTPTDPTTPATPTDPTIPVGPTTPTTPTTPVVALASGEIKIASSITNDNGKLIANGLSTLNTTNTLTNSSTIDVENLNASGSSLENNGGTINANNINISTTNTTNTTGKISSNTLTNINSKTLSGNGEIISNGNLNIKLSSDYINTMKINGFNTTINIAGDLTNNSELVSSNITNISATNISNVGLIDGYITNLKATNIVNNKGAGRIYGDYLALQADTINNLKENDKSAVIGARETLNIGANYINNRDGSEIISLGTLNIGGTLDDNKVATGKASEINNLSATIESGRDMSLAGEDIKNISSTQITKTIETFTKTLNITCDHWRVSGCSDIKLPLGIDLMTIKSEILEKATANGTTLSDSELRAKLTTEMIRLDTEANILNGFKSVGLPSPHYSDYPFVYDIYASLDSNEMIVSQNNRKPDAGLSDGRQIGEEARTITYTANKDVVDPASLANHKPSQIISGGNLTIDSTNLLNRTSSITAAKDMRLNGNLANEGVELYTNIEASPFYQYKARTSHNGYYGELQYINQHTSSVPATITAGGTLTGNFGSLQNGMETNKPIVNTQNEIDDNQVDGFTKTTPNTSMPNSSLFAVNPNNPDYFIQTDPKFTNYKSFISSDYMLKSLGVDPTTMHKRMGDGYYEQKLVREQIMNLTGKRFLDGFNSDEAQYMALLNSGVEYMKAYGISVGVSLSAEQMKNR